MTDEIRTVGTTRSVHLERDYQASPVELWQAWTDPSRMARWLGVPAGPLLDAAAPVRIVMGDGAEEWVEVHVLTADPPHLLELRWDFPSQADTRLRVELRALNPNLTRLVLDHYGLGSSATGYGAGWQAYLEGGLARELGGEVDTSWEQRFARALPSWQQRSATTA